MMAATTALMQHSSAGGGSNQLTTAPDSDSISDSGHSPLVVVEEQRSSSEDEMACEKKRDQEEELMVESELDDEDDDEEHEIYVGNSSNGAKSGGDDSTEDEGTIVDEEQNGGNAMAPSQSSLASLSSLINLKLNCENGTSSNGGSAKRSTGKLERITERLAKKQNGVLNPVEPVVTHESPSNGDDKKDDVSMEDDDDLLDEEDDDDVKSGFRALGLVGNVAFMGDDAYKCPVCGIKLDSQHTFTLHIRSHNPNDHSNTCSLCGKTLSSASSLDRHMLIHSGERPFKCTLCGMAFTTNGNMHRHMRTHGHGQIGYTPRGQKRRQKLLTQALEKMAAAAANGEEVDPEQINKLKKSILDTKSNIPIPSNSGKRKSAPPQATDIAAAMNNIPAMAANSGSIEAAAAAAVAAAAHKTKLNTQNTPSASHPASDALGLAGTIWPKPEQFVFPTEKAKPGRKKKNRMSYPLPSHTSASPLVPPGVPTTSATSAPTLPVGLSPESFLAAAHQASAQFGTRCPICTQPMRGNPELHYHMSTLHSQEKLFCLDCGMILENYDTYTHHHCTASAASVMTALSQNPTIRSDLLFASTNTNRMNFSSARAAALGPLFNFAPGMANQQQAQQQLMAQQLTKLFGAASLPKDHPAAFASMLHDFQSKFAAPGPQLVPPQQAPPASACRQCHRKFANTKELKLHHETFCHQCDIDCHDQATLFAHQLGHQFSALEGDKLQVLKSAMSAFRPNLGLASQLISNPQVSQPPAPTKIPKSSTPSTLSASTLDLSAPSSLASLNSMADMKPDLADIQSILSMVNGTAKATKLTESNEPGPSRLPSRSPISPNRASDAGSHNRSGGDATNQPDSPASADSAAGAVAASNAVSTTEGQHHTRTDLNHNDNEIALCLKHEIDDDEDLPPAKRVRSNSNSSNSSMAPQTITSTENGDMSEGKSAISGSSPDMVRFRCEPCKLSFKSLNALRRHNRGHTAGGGHSHACHLCPYKSLDKSTLIRHLRTHNGERPFQCAICKYAFTTKANCERHVRKRHRNLKSKVEIRNAMQYNHDMAATAAATRLVSEKIFIERDELPTSQDTICKQCHADFGTNRDLRAHLRAPNNPCSQQLKPFVCTICKIGFNTRNNCVRHIIKQHPSTLSEEEAAEAAKAAAAEESFMIETGSSSSLSPSSNPPMHSYGSMSSGSSEHLSECESYGTYDEEGTTPTKYPNSSFAALCQVADQQVNGRRSHTTPGSPLNLSKKTDDTDDDDDDGVEDDGEEDDGGALVLDLSCKSK